MQSVSVPVLRPFSQDQGDAMPLFVFPALEETGFVKHAFTTRKGGVSQGIYASLNLSFSRGDDEEAVKTNYRRLAQALCVPYGSFVCADQTHTANVVRVGREHASVPEPGKKGFTDVDGMVTNVPQVTLITFFADCVPLYFVDPVHRAIALSHSGWRGTVGRIGRVTLETMKREFGTDPQDTVCAIGPSICRDCYEVGADVAEEFEREFAGRKNEILTAKGNGKYQLDLWRANEIVLMEAGVKKERISTTQACTCCHCDLLFSHRASKGRRGNLAALLSII